jgi:hypothetical protein
LSEELAFRANQSFAWEEALIEARKVIDHANLIAAGTLRQFMLDAGYTPISTSKGRVWAEPGSAISEEVRKFGEMGPKP